MNSLVTALPGLVPIFVSAGGVNALAGVLFLLFCERRVGRSKTSVNIIANTMDQIEFKSLSNWGMVHSDNCFG